MVDHAENVWIENWSLATILKHAVVSDRARSTFRPHPVFGWTFRPNITVRPTFRPDVIQHIGCDGCRVVPGGPPDGSSRADLVLYGCSVAYGFGLADEETLAAHLQAAFPERRIANRAVSGWGSVQAFLRFRRDIADRSVGAAIFGVIHDHRYRNVPHPGRMRGFLEPDWHQIGVEHVPVATLDSAGHLRIVYRHIWQPSLVRDDYEVFLPDDYLVGHVTLHVLETISRLGRDNGVPVLFAMLDNLDPDFGRALCTRLDRAVDVSVPKDETHSFLPVDPHPNPHANRLYAERLAAPVTALLG